MPLLATLLALALSGAGCLGPRSLPPAPGLDEQAQTPAVRWALQRGRQLTGWVFDGRVAELDAVIHPELRRVFLQQAPDVATLFGRLAAVGTETAVLEEHAIPFLGGQVYVRTSLYEGYATPLDVQWTFDAAGTVVGFHYRGHAEPAYGPYEDHATKAALRLPFEDTWLVYWGGRSAAQNYHVVEPSQRFAYDLLIARDDATHFGDGSRNDQYYCWNQPIVAPGDGRVVSMANDVLDNVPGQMNPQQILGNHVILDHGTGEYSLMAHFRQGSLRVVVGDWVRQGTVLGRAGNSGNSSEPHLHYHLQDDPVFGNGIGMPAQFLGYAADGVAVERGEPTRGQLIEHLGG